MLQRTLARSVGVTGIGLHSSERIALTLHPAEENSGTSFRRIDSSREIGGVIQLNPYLVNNTRLSPTTVTDKDVRIGTIEHIISTLSAYGIGNVLIELNAPEIPVMDDSSLPPICLLQDAGVVGQKTQKCFLKILKPIKIKETGKWVRLTPYNGFKVTLTIEFGHPVFNCSSPTFEIDLAGKSYIDEVARVHTFSFMREVEMMRAHNLGLGGNLNNAIMIDDIDVLNPESLRYPNGFVRHKILDAIGDLYIAGHPIIGASEGYKSGHTINNVLLRAVLTNETAYEWVEFTDDEELPTAFHELPVA